MPIGKNALKRVENNGYSKVKSTAPDMENSEVVGKVEAPVKAEEKAVKAAPAPKKTTAKKPAAKKAPAKKPAVKVEAKAEEKPAEKAPVAKKPAAKKTAPKAKKVGKAVEPAIALGGELPYYLL